MHKVLLLCAAGLIVFAPVHAMANFEDGNSLYQGCSSDTYNPANIFTLGYVLGIIDDTLDKQASNGNSPSVCLPRNVTQGQIRDVVCKGLANNPQERQFSASSLAFYYLKTAFPCH